jgi:hypothetical protein
MRCRKDSFLLRQRNNGLSNYSTEPNQIDPDREVRMNIPLKMQ